MLKITVPYFIIILFNIQQRFYLELELGFNECFINFNVRLNCNNVYMDFIQPNPTASLQISNFLQTKWTCFDPNPKE